VKPTFGTIPCVRFKIIICILRSVGSGNQNSHTNENENDYNEKIK